MTQQTVDLRAGSNSVFKKVKKGELIKTKYNNFLLTDVAAIDLWPIFLRVGPQNSIFCNYGNKYNLPTSEAFVETVVNMQTE